MKKVIEEEMEFNVNKNKNLILREKNKQAIQIKTIISYLFKMFVDPFCKCFLLYGVSFICKLIINIKIVKTQLKKFTINLIVFQCSYLFK